MAAEAIPVIEGYGTSEGLKKAWDARGRGRAKQLADRDPF